MTVADEVEPARTVLVIVSDAGAGTEGLRGVDSNSGSNFVGEVSGVLV